MKAIKSDSKIPLVVHNNQDYTLCIKMTRVNRATERKAYAPRFPKPKDEGWFLTLGHVDSVELLALKRVPFIQNTSHQLIAFSTPLKPGKLLYI